MPYLPTSQSFLEQSSLLLEAYPDTTRITTKYTYPSTITSSSKAAKSSKATKSKQPPPSSAETQQDPSTPTSTEPKATTAPIATLTLKTYNPVTGICLKYRTNKAAEVGRLVSGLGRLAAGAKHHEFSPVNPSTAGAGAPGGALTGATTGRGDVEMADAPTINPPVVSGQDGGKPPGGGGGGKGKKGKGKGGKR